MSYLLDTCTFLWLISNPIQLSRTASQITQDPNHDLSFSVISSWEITLKVSVGRLHLGQPPDLLVPAQRSLLGINFLTLKETAVFHLTKLPALHKDPFDRMLVCQAIIDDLTILTPDPLIQQYPVKTAW